MQQTPLRDQMRPLNIAKDTLNEQRKWKYVRILKYKLSFCARGTKYTMFDTQHKFQQSRNSIGVGQTKFHAEANKTTINVKIVRKNH